MSMKNPSNNAMITKLKIMYSKRISAGDYSRFLRYSSIREIVDALKSMPSYAKFFADFDAAHFDIDKFKKSINSLVFADFETIMRYNRALLCNFYKYIVIRNEVRSIIRAILSVISANSRDIFFDTPPFLASKSRIDFSKLRNSRTYDQILDAVSNTKYSRILQKYAPGLGNKTFDFIGIEIALQNFLHSSCIEITRTSSHGELTRFLKNYIDLKNFVLIYRMKNFYDFDPKTIMSRLLKNGNVSQNKLIGIVNCSKKDVVSKIRETRIGYKWFENDLQFIDNIPNKMRLEWCKKQMCNSFDMITVIFSYIILAEIEVSDLLCLVEGMQNGFSGDEIRKNIIAL